MNLKKCTGVFLAFLLLVSNIGFAFDVHYCGGKIASVSISKVSPEKKCCGDKEKKSDDATFKVFFFQIAFPAVIHEFKSLAFSSVPNFKSKEVISYYADANAPPLYQLYHQYIFYA